MNKFHTMVCVLVIIGFTSILVAKPVAAQKSVYEIDEQTERMPSPLNSEIKTGAFVKKRYSITGNWTIKTDGNQTLITFDDQFKTKGGPDLKLYLSPKDLNSLSSDTAEMGSVKIGVLKSNRGSQTYIVPDTIDLSDYKSLIIHCEAFSVLWGGFDLME